MRSWNIESKTWLKARECVNAPCRATFISHNILTLFTLCTIKLSSCTAKGTAKWVWPTSSLLLKCGDSNAVVADGCRGKGGRHAPRSRAQTRRWLQSATKHEQVTHNKNAGHTCPGTRGTSQVASVTHRRNDKDLYDIVRRLCGRNRCWCCCRYGVAARADKARVLRFGVLDPFPRFARGRTQLAQRASAFPRACVAAAPLPVVPHICETGWHGRVVAQEVLGLAKVH